jgi:hypothetical protein
MRPYADLAESAGFVQRDAGGVFGKDSGLQGPDSVDFGFLDEGLQQRLANASASRRSSHVDGNLGNPSVNAADGNRAEGSPSEDAKLSKRNQTIRGIVRERFQSY